jgi:trehalose-phosphatase
MARNGILDGIPAALWRMVALARRRLLMLDYDGTLAPLRNERLEARPQPRSLELVRRIADSGRTELAIVSGRQLPEVEALLGPLRATFVGEHGWEWRAPGGEWIRQPLEDAVVQALDEAERIARQAGWGALIERKRSAVVLQTPSLPAPQALEIVERCASAWGGLIADSKLVLDRPRGGLELRASGVNKGTVVRWLMPHAGPGALGVFVGDDVTDEDAFEAVREWGFGVRVGDPAASSIAQGRLPSSDAVPEFLAEWARVTAAPPAPERSD